MAELVSLFVSAEEPPATSSDGDKGFAKEIDSDSWGKTISVLRQWQTKKTLPLVLQVILYIQKDLVDLLISKENRQVRFSMRTFKFWDWEVNISLNKPLTLLLFPQMILDVIWADTHSCVFEQLYSVLGYSLHISFPDLKIMKLMIMFVSPSWVFTSLWNLLEKKYWALLSPFQIFSMYRKT